MFVESVKKWWLWGYYISPMMYGDNAIIVNEFRGHSWKHVCFLDHDIGDLFS